MDTSCTYIFHHHNHCYVSAFQNGCTALHIASQEGHVAVVRLLIEARAVINQQIKVRPGIHCACTVCEDSPAFNGWHCVTWIHTVLCTGRCDSTNLGFPIWTCSSSWTTATSKRWHQHLWWGMQISIVPSESERSVTVPVMVIIICLTLSQCSL